jgi:hypothetical protein
MGTILTYNSGPIPVQNEYDDDVYLTKLQHGSGL